jgi:hypothetical protein
MSGQDDAFATGIDIRSDELTPAEAESMKRWYEKVHGSGNLDLVRYVPFMLANNPAALKRFRFWADSVAGGRGLADPLPAALMAMIWLHFYSVNPFPSGLLYEVIAARQWGASKQEVIDVLTLGWLHGGPSGIEAVATSTADYIAGWEPQPSEGLTWPAGWKRDPAAFRSGIELDDRNELSAEEVDRLTEWHREYQGQVPEWVPVLARRYPLALKAYRARYEAACSGTLAAPFIPLLQLAVAAFRGDSGAIRRLVFQARRLGASEDQVVNVVATTQCYMGDIGMGPALAALEEALGGSA